MTNPILTLMPELLIMREALYGKDTLTDIKVEMAKQADEIVKGIQNDAYERAAHVAFLHGASPHVVGSIRALKEK